MKPASTLRGCIRPDDDGVTGRNPRDRSFSRIDIDLSAPCAQEPYVRPEHVDSPFAVGVQAGTFMEPVVIH